MKVISIFSSFRENDLGNILAGCVRKDAQAQRLLRKGRPVALVAEDVGYNSQPAFSRAFIRELGVSPSAWIR